MRSAFPWIALAVIVLALGVGLYWAVSTVQSTARPLVSLPSTVATQVADFLHPTPTVLPDPVTIVREVRALARLETIQYTVEKVIVAETGQGTFGFLFGDRLLLVAHGSVIAGLDLGKVEPEDVWFDSSGRAYLRLPEPEVFVATLDNEQSYVYDRETGVLTRGDLNLEATARRAAEQAILDAALEDGILEQARTNGENVLYRLLRSLEIPDVIFVGEDETPGEIPATP